MRRGPPAGHDLRISLTVEQDHDGVLVARLVVDEPDGLRVEVELTGDELALLLAGETLEVPGQVSEPVLEPEPPPEPPPEPEDVAPAAPSPAPPLASHGTDLDDPPPGTEPIARSTDVALGEAVLAFIRGRWRDAVVVRRDIGSLLVTYSRPGSFGRVQQRLATSRVRRRT
jgi:hypothetical protein